MPEKKYRILLVHNRYRIPGGEDAVFAAEAEALRAAGHTVMEYCRSNTELDGHPFKKLLLPFASIYSPRTAAEVRALLRQFQPDLVHVHNTLTMVSPSVFYACFKQGVPVVQTLHNFRLLCPNGILMREGRVCEDCPQKGLQCVLRHKCYRNSTLQSLVGAAILWVHRRLGTYRRVGLIAITPFDRDKFLQYNQKLNLFDPRRMWVKPHMVPVPEGRPIPLSARKRRFVFVGRLETLKGIDTLLKGWAEDLPPLIVVGDGPREADARQMAPANVEFAGRLDPKEVQRLMAESLAVVVPSLCYESFSLVVAEAHAAGTPVLGSDLGNVGRLIDPERDGLRFTPGNPQSLHDTAARLAQLAPQLDAAAIREKAREAFAPDRNLTRLVDIYQELLKESKP